MWRYITRLLGIVLAVVLLPTPAYASEGVVGAVDTTFADQNLYDAVVAELTDRGIAHTADPNTKNVRLTATENAHVKELNLGSHAISNIEGLEQFCALETLDLSHNLVATSSQFASMPNLADLNLYDNYVHDLSGLANLTNLTHLNLGDNNETSSVAQMTNLDALSTLTSLTWLDFSRNQTPGVTTHIKNLTGLTHLHLMKNNLTSVEDLGGLTNLKTLILSHNLITGVSALANLTELEDLEMPVNPLYVEGYYKPNNSDSTGIDGLFNANGGLKLTNLKKLDLWERWSASKLTDSTLPRHKHVNDLYQMMLDGNLEFGYYYPWIDSLNTSNLMHVDGDVRYVAYDDFHTFCDGTHDDFNAMRNAHYYARVYDCEVRATVGGDNAAAGKNYHIFRYYETEDHGAYGSVNWQNATFTVHDDLVDMTAGRHEALFYMSLAAPGTKESEAPYSRQVTLATPDLTINDGRKLGRASTSIAGLSPQVDAAIAKLNSDYGYQRFYIQAFNENKKQFIRYNSINDIDPGDDQWDGFIVGLDGTIETYNSASMTTPKQASYVPTTPQPVQWDFDTLTKVVITPIPKQKAYVKNGHFIYLPEESGVEGPRDRSGKRLTYDRNFIIRNSVNIEISNVTQEVGGSGREGGDGCEFTGSYSSFLSIRNCADVYVHDCTAWARRCTHSTYGISFDHLTVARFVRVNNSNSWEQQLGQGGRRWGS